MHVLDRECARASRRGPWISRMSEAVWVLLPTGRVISTDSFTAALYAQETAFDNVEPSEAVIRFCENPKLSAQPGLPPSETLRSLLAGIDSRLKPPG